MADTEAGRGLLFLIVSENGVVLQINSEEIPGDGERSTARDGLSKEAVIVAEHQLS